MSEEKEELTREQYAALSAVYVLKGGTVEALARYAEQEAPVLISYLELFLERGWIVRVQDGMAYQVGQAEQELTDALDTNYRRWVKESLLRGPPGDLLLYAEYLAEALYEETDLEKRVALVAKWKKDLPSTEIPLWQSLELNLCHRAAAGLFDQMWGLCARAVDVQGELNESQRAARGFASAILALVRAGMTDADIEARNK